MSLFIQISIFQEVLMVVWFMAEYFVRIWSAGCRSRYQQLSGRLEFMRRPLCIVGREDILPRNADCCLIQLVHHTFNFVTYMFMLV